jgi:hypothetical protein
VIAKNVSGIVERDIPFEDKVSYINDYLRERGVAPLPTYIRNGNRAKVNEMYSAIKQGKELGKIIFKDRSVFEKKIHRICEETNTGKLQCKLIDIILQKGYSKEEARFFSKAFLEEDPTIGVFSRVSRLPLKQNVTWPTGYYG